MLIHSSILLAAAPSADVLELVFWIVFGVIFWIVTTVKAINQKKNARKAGTPPPGAAPASSPPETEELVEIFRRLGANIPGTPPPQRPPAAPHPAVHPRTAAMLWPQAAPLPPPPRKPQPSPSPAAIIAQRERLKAKQKAERKAALAADSIQAGDGISARPDDDRAVSGATRLSQLVLPRIHALDLPLTPFPAVPLPGLERKTRNAPPPRLTLHTRKEIRAALRAKYLLQAPKSLTP